MNRHLVLLTLFVAALSYPVPDGNPHTFDFKGTEFTLDGEPFRFVACEVHYPRIPKVYWEHRLMMSKALGCNTLSAYVFWNYHEMVEGVFDFKTEERDLGEFIRLAQRLDMWVFIRPGPYVCAEWDAGGHPWWLMKQEIELRTIDPLYMKYVRSYVTALTEVLSPLQVQKGGNILMLQIENEFGYLNWDRNFVDALKQLWDESGLQLKYYQAEPHTGVAITHIPGAAIGINPGVLESFFEEARQVDANVPLFSSETWLGWFTHWGDANWGHQEVQDSLNQVQFLISHGYSFSIYMAHGGTSFGFWAGANAFDGVYQPDIGSYDYDSAISESGDVTERFTKLRELIKTFALWEVPAIPEHVPYIDIAEFKPTPLTNLLSALREGPTSEHPITHEKLDQAFGLVSYTTMLGQIEAGSVLEANVHDYAQVYVNDEHIGTIDRRLGENSIVIPNAYSAGVNTITILVEAMGRINFGSEIYDQKGIIGTVQLNKQVLKNWGHGLIPLDNVVNLQATKSISPFIGQFFHSNVDIPEVGDTYLDMSAWGKGYVWVNGRNLGRFWNIGPQHKLYLPGAFLRKGLNSISVLDLNQNQPQVIKGVRQMK